MIQCSTCKYGVFKLTRSGKIKRGTKGDCSYTIWIPITPFCVDIEIERQRISPTDGQQCKMYSRKGWSDE